jgi:hypothetical protein
MHTEKQNTWDRIRAKVDRTCDPLRMPIDEGIKETVIVLNALGFKTVGSCEGHLDRALLCPWVWFSLEGSQNQTLEKSASHALRMIDLLEEFYENRKPLKYARVSLDLVGKGDFRIGSAVRSYARDIKTEDPTLYETIHRNSVSEMKDFTEFLKQKFWNNT